MLEGIEADKGVCDVLGGVIRILAAQAYALDRLFYRAAKEAFSTEIGSYYHARKALKAQARCRATFKVLLALRSAAADGKKFPDSIERTIQTLKMASVANSLARLEPSAPPPAPVRRPNHRTLERSKRWSAERRARQAAAIRTWQPWQKSTGPRTANGKKRSAANALKHGHRAKAYIQLRREDRLLLTDSAGNIAIAKALNRRLLLRGTSARMQRVPDLSAASLPAAARRAKAGHSIGIGRVRPALVPFASQILGESRSRRIPPADNAASRRRWRIAS